MLKDKFLLLLYCKKKLHKISEVDVHV